MTEVYIVVVEYLREYQRSSCGCEGCTCEPTPRKTVEDYFFETREAAEAWAKEWVTAIYGDRAVIEIEKLTKG